MSYLYRRNHKVDSERTLSKEEADAFSFLFLAPDGSGARTVVKGTRLGS